MIASVILIWGAGISYDLLLSRKVELGVALSSFGFIPAQQSFVGEHDSASYNHSEWLARGYYSYQLTPKVRMESRFQLISQSNTSEVMLGLISHYSPFYGKNIHVSLGFLRQFNVAYVAYGGLSYKNYAVNVSYDFVSQPLNTLREISGLSRPERIGNYVEFQRIH